MEEQQRRGALEAILFVAGEAVALEDVARALEMTVLECDAWIEKMAQLYTQEQRGVEIVRIEDKVQFATARRYADAVQAALKPLSEKTLSKSVLETLSIVAYKQPVTRSEIENIRGVSADYSLRTLLQRRLIEPVGRKEVVGRPMMYGTTDEFMRHFGLSTLSELPPLPDAVPEEEPMPL